MNPDPELERLERLEERVREAFPACQHPAQVVILPRGEMLQARYESAREFASLTPHQQKNIIARQRKASRKAGNLYA